MSLIRLENLRVRFPQAGGAPREAVREVSFAIERGETLGLVGESGSGKSVTALSILRLLPPQALAQGQIFFQDILHNGEEVEVLSASEEKIRHLRGERMAMIFQEPMTALNPVMRIGEQVAEAVLAHRRSDKASAWKTAAQALRDAGLPDAERRARDYPHQLSGGMRQRVMIAMAIVNRPQLLIADEPTTALDVTVQAQVLDLLAELRHKFNLAMLFISHDLAVVSHVADRIAVMYAGSIVELGKSAEIFRQPAHPYTRGLLQAVPTLKTDRKRPLATIEGTVPAQDLPPGCAFEPRCAMRIPQCARELPPLLEIAPGHLARCPVVNA